MKLVVTIDTEEDNWGDFIRTGCSLQNIEKIPALQHLFDDYGVRPTYLITYPVANNKRAVSLLRSIQEEGRCEIGTHCHPWNTPPHDEVIGEKNSMLCNLSNGLQFQKIKNLHNMITKNFAVSPTSFRSGRWSFGQSLAASLEKLGYRVDTSVLPLSDLSSEHGPDNSKLRLEPYWFNADNIYKRKKNGTILEIPASIDFTQSNFRWASILQNYIQTSSLSKTYIIGILFRLRLLNKIWLSPERNSSQELIRLTKKLIKRGVPLINLFFHSPTLLPGLTPFVKIEADRISFIKMIETFLIFTKEAGIESIRLSEAIEVIPRC